jgi:hypothetical protein
MSRHVDSRNSGVHVLHAGGPYDSHLVVPTLPVEIDAPDWRDE